MRKIGGHVSIAGNITNAIMNTVKIGGNCMQIFAGSPRVWERKLFSNSDVEKFNAQIKDHDLSPVFIHALYLVNLATDKVDLLEKSIGSVIMDLKNGNQINSAGVILHLGSHQGRGFKESLSQIVTSIEQIFKETSGCDLILENDAGQNGKIGSVEELSEIITMVNSDRLKVCLDTAHLFEGGLDMREKSQVEKFIDELKALDLLNKVVCIHLNDSATDLDSHHDKHADLGQGKIGLDGLRNLVNHSSLKHLPLLLETPGPDKSGPNATNIKIAHSL